MVPAAGPADLDDVHRELLCGGVEPGDLLCGACRSRHLAEFVAEHPGHQRDLLFSADRADRFAGFSVEFRSPQQIRIRITNLGHGDPSGVDLGQPRPTLEGVIDDLALHEFQGTWSRARTCVRRPTGLRVALLRRNHRLVVDPHRVHFVFTTEWRQLYRCDTLGTTSARGVVSLGLISASYLHPTRDQ